MLEPVSRRLWLIGGVVADIRPKMPSLSPAPLKSQCMEQGAPNIDIDDQGVNSIGQKNVGHVFWQKLGRILGFTLVQFDISGKFLGNIWGKPPIELTPRESLERHSRMRLWPSSLKCVTNTIEPIVRITIRISSVWTYMP